VCILFLFPSCIRSMFFPINVVRHTTSTHPYVCAVDGVGKISTISNRKGGYNRYLSDKITIYKNARQRISVAISWSLIRYSDNFSFSFDRISYGKIRFSLFVCLFLFFCGDLVFIFMLFSGADTVWKSPKSHGLLTHSVSTHTKKRGSSYLLFCLWSVSIASP
jgi:hypothetical protein